METMGTFAAAEKWGVPQNRIARAWREGKIKGAEQDAPGRPWRIPSDTENPFQTKNI